MLIIKYYKKNRCLYSPLEGTYIGLSKIRDYVYTDVEFKVVAQDGMKDITSKVLIKALFDIGILFSVDTLKLLIKLAPKEAGRKISSNMLSIINR